MKRVGFAAFGVFALFLSWMAARTPLRVTVEADDVEGYKRPRLQNEYYFPVIVEKCTYTTDTNDPGETIAYNMEKWDRNRGQWVRAFTLAVPELCSPMPTSHGGTNWKRTLLWPGQTLTGWGFPLDRFDKGDWIRFEAVTGVNTSGSSHHSAAFRVE